MKSVDPESASHKKVHVILSPAFFAGRRACPELVEGTHGFACNMGGPAATPPLPALILTLHFTCKAALH